MVKLITLAAAIVDIVLFISLHNAVPNGVKLVAGPCIYLTMVALVSLFLGCLIFKLQTAKVKREGKTLDDYEMSVFQEEAKWNRINQQEDTDVDGEEKLNQLRELLYSILGPTSPKQLSISAGASPLSHSFHSRGARIDELHEHEEEDEPGSNFLIHPWPRKLGPPKLQAISVKEEKGSSSPYSHVRSQSLPFQGVPLRLPDSPFSIRIVPDMSIEGSPMFPPPSFRSAIPSSGIASNVSSRRTSSLRSQNIQRNPSNSSSLSTNYRPKSPKAKKPRRPTHIASTSLGLRMNTMASTSSSTLDSMIPQFPPVPPSDLSYYPYGTFRMGGRNKFDSHISSSSSGGGKTPLSALPSSDGDGPVRMEDLDDVSVMV